MQAKNLNQIDHICKELRLISDSLMEKANIIGNK